MLLKSCFDRFASFFGLIFFCPVLFVVAILIKVKMPEGPVIFKQKRVGKAGCLFTMYKFRSMTVGHDGSSVSVAGDARITPLGAVLRKYKLDELPELWNVLKGDMALIGPRPLLVQYLPLYSKEQARRHEVRPGITGWAQCNGRNAISWTRKFELDVWYVDHCSFLLDLRILFITLKKVFVREGISQEGQATMEFFTGNN